MSWEHRVSQFQETSAGISILANLLLIFLIIFKSPKQIGPYKYLMIYISFFEICYSIMDVIMKPMIFSHASFFLVFSNFGKLPFSSEISYILFMIWTGFFGTFMAIFVLQFFYRYLVATKSSLSTFNDYRIIYWMIIPQISGIFWATFIHFLLHPNQNTENYIRNMLLVEFDWKIEETVYFGAYLYQLNENNNSYEFDWDSMIGIILGWIIVIISLVLVLFFAIKCYLNINSYFLNDNNNNNNMISKNLIRLQYQLFYALVTQTLIPVILMHIPIAIIFISTILAYDLSHTSSLFSITIALFPALDPFPCMIIIQNYRNVVSKVFFNVYSEGRFDEMFEDIMISILQVSSRTNGKFTEAMKNLQESITGTKMEIVVCGQVLSENSGPQKLFDYLNLESVKFSETLDEKPQYEYKESINHKWNAKLKIRLRSPMGFQMTRFISINATSAEMNLPIQLAHMKKLTFHRFEITGGCVGSENFDRSLIKDEWEPKTIKVRHSAREVMKIVAESITLYNQEWLFDDRSLIYNEKQLRLEFEDFNAFTDAFLDRYRRRNDLKVLPLTDEQKRMNHESKVETVIITESVDHMVFQTSQIFEKRRDESKKEIWHYLIEISCEEHNMEYWLIRRMHFRPSYEFINNKERNVELMTSDIGFLLEEIEITARNQSRVRAYFDIRRLKNVIKFESPYLIPKHISAKDVFLKYFTSPPSLIFDSCTTKLDDKKSDTEISAKFGCVHYYPKPNNKKDGYRHFNIEVSGELDPKRDIVKIHQLLIKDAVRAGVNSKGVKARDWALTVSKLLVGTSSLEYQNWESSMKYFADIMLNFSGDLDDFNSSRILPLDSSMLSHPQRTDHIDEFMNKFELPFIDNGGSTDYTYHEKFEAIIEANPNIHAKYDYNEFRIYLQYFASYNKLRRDYFVNNRDKRLDMKILTNEPNHFALTITMVFDNFILNKNQSSGDFYTFMMKVIKIRDDWKISNMIITPPFLLLDTDTLQKRSATNHREIINQEFLSVLQSVENVYQEPSPDMIKFDKCQLDTSNLSAFEAHNKFLQFCRYLRQQNFTTPITSSIRQESEDLDQYKFIITYKYAIAKVSKYVEIEFVTEYEQKLGLYNNKKIILSCPVTV
ncbi:unnamed protein product [Caenorhabditis angaria]|uniref:Uncharacterized protein n=1 Tax=Caenorhabditis angaria TaxID=860376 RepID=A0A9P1I6J5_9PELO|nr:unnamed protein product [Caenorhabditis angaria]